MIAASPSTWECSRSGGFLASQRGLEPGDEMAHHRVVLRELAQGPFELGVLGGDRREEVTVLPFVVPGQRGAEPPAEEDEVRHDRRFGLLAVDHLADE